MVIKDDVGSGLTIDMEVAMPGLITAMEKLGGVMTGDSKAGKARKQRKKGNINKGSFSETMSLMEVGEEILFPESKTLSEMHLDIRRFETAHPELGKFQAQRCIGHTFDLSEKPFKFVRIKRII